MVLITVVITAGTVGYHIAGMSWIDALYQTVITVSTVGYADLSDSLDVRLFTITMIGIGTITIAILISLVTGAVVEAQIRETFGRHKVESRVRKLEQHIIICGFGRFGRTIATQLADRKIPFVILEKDSLRCQHASDLGHLVLQVDATEEESLVRAGIEHSVGLLTTLDSDASNVYVALTAKQMVRGLTVVALAHEETAEKKLRAAGADEVVSPYLLGGTYMAQAIMSPTVSDFMKMATGVNPLNFFMDEQLVDKDSPLCGKQLKDTPIRSELGVIVLAVRHAGGALVSNPPPDIELGAGDVLVSLGERSQLERLKQVAAGGD